MRDFHITRAELRHVAVSDYEPTLRVEYQGDRIQLLRHLPHDDAAKRALPAAKIAAAWNSSLTETLPDVVGLEGLGIATGIADGPSLVSRLGTRGNRDVVIVGPGVRRAERIQRNLDGGEFGVDGAVLDALPEDVQALFDWRAGAQAHVCVDGDINDIELALRAATYDGRSAQSVSTTATKVAVGAAGAALLGAAAKAAARPKLDGPPSPNGHDRGGHQRREGAQDDGHSDGRGGQTDVIPQRRWAP